MKTQNFTKEQLELIIQGMVAMYEVAEPVEVEKKLEVFITEYKEHFVINFNWNVGEKQTDVECGIADFEYLEENYFFKLLKTENINKLAKEVSDAVGVVNDKKYEFDLDI